MSLVGSLEDLGLGDILQIVSMARKSGILVLRSDAGEGRIVFRDGMVRAAFTKGEPEDLRGLLVGGGFLGDADFDRAADAARGGGGSVDAALAEHTPITAEKLASLRREHVERSVVRMFTWKSGEFSFDVREDFEARDAELMLAQGLNTQYLAMEAMRLGDESQRDRADVAGGALDEASPEDQERAAPESDGAPTSEASPAPADAAAGSGTGGPRVAALIAIDADLDALEWEKAALAGLFPRIHIFQRCESGIARIRQYLGRGELPVVLLSARAHEDDGVDVDDLAGLVARLRMQAPPMPILVIHEEADAAPSGAEAADRVLSRPTTGRLKAPRAARKREEAAQALREAVRPWAARSQGGGPGGRPGAGAAASASGAETTGGRDRSPAASTAPP
jgi:hypothetical protein